jgi:uncharacterized protein involved in exopolysaccharide biosynthesis
MPDTQNTTHATQSLPDDEDEISLLDLLIVLAKHKKMIFITTFVAALLSAGVTLLMSNIYTGTTKILPPQQNQSSANAMLNQLGGLAGMAGSSLGIKNPNDLYIGMLKSRNVMEKVAKRFDLQKIYETKTMTDTLKKLNSNVSVASGKDGIITVEVDDKDPKRAADLANAFIEELDKLMQTFSLTEASQKGLFFERQLKQARDKLTDAELALDKTPTTSLHYMDAVRNVKYQEAVWEILAKQYEMAKLDEAKDYPLIQILDVAFVPEKKSKPHRTWIVEMFTLIAFLFVVVWAIINESIARAKQRPEHEERLMALRNAFRLRSKA